MDNSEIDFEEILAILLAYEEKKRLQDQMESLSLQPSKQVELSEPPQPPKILEDDQHQKIELFQCISEAPDEQPLIRQKRDQFRDSIRKQELNKQFSVKRRIDIEPLDQDESGTKEYSEKKSLLIVDDNQEENNLCQQFEKQEQEEGEREDQMQPPEKKKKRRQRRSRG